MTHDDWVTRSREDFVEYDEDSVQEGIESINKIIQAEVEAALREARGMIQEAYDLQKRLPLGGSQFSKQFTKGEQSERRQGFLSGCLTAIQKIDTLLKTKLNA